MTETLLPFPFDFKKPDYNQVFEYRIEKLKKIRENPEVLPALKEFYKKNTAQFITDWGITDDPRNAAMDLPSIIPFVLMPIQIEWINAFEECLEKKIPLITEKSREMGVSWTAIAKATTHCLFRDGMSVGFGSRKQEYVDAIGKPDSLLYKVRLFIKNLPKEFRGIWDERKHSSICKIIFPETGSSITGEAGDNIGRGARKTYFHVDESAWLERQESVDAALSQTTNCRSDISTPHGMGNSFARRRHSGNIKVFTIRWQDDPRKDQAWYDKVCKDIDDPIIVAQEIDINYKASIDGIIIPAQWVDAAIDAHKKLGIEPAGERRCSLDIADEGRDKNAITIAKGILVEHIQEWSGINSDIFATVQKTAGICDERDCSLVIFDEDGMGAGARGDARIINEARQKNKLNIIDFVPFRGSGEVLDKEKEVFQRKAGDLNIARAKSRTNGDYYGNAKAQGWGDLRNRFKNTYRAIVEGGDYNKDDIISISSNIPKKELNKLKIELSQPTWKQNEAGLMYVDKKPDGASSPNYADSVMMMFAKNKNLRRKVFL